MRTTYSVRRTTTVPLAWRRILDRLRDRAYPAPDGRPASSLYVVRRTLYAAEPQARPPYVPGEGFEPPKAYTGRFTVCSLWPLGHPGVFALRARYRVLSTEYLASASGRWVG